jgi:hypothetical protein
MVLDETGRVAGRGAYLCRNADCWSAAGKRHALEHALGASIPDDLAAQLAAGPDALGSTIGHTPSGAAITAPAPALNMIEGGTDGQE